LRQSSGISIGKGSDPSSTWIRDHFQAELLSLCQRQLTPLRLTSSGWLKVFFHYLTSSPGSDIRQGCLNWLRYETLDEAVIQSLGLAPGENPRSEPVDIVNETCWLRIHDSAGLRGAGPRPARRSAPLFEPDYSR